ncbi:hypothetical protein [Nocardioides panacisoli]|uniref:Uncharacterized protein n=1 Tax=Nocardioides panacisoli TaxID=627624 RepID=A0ABP7I8F4_9ACTN
MRPHLVALACLGSGALLGAALTPVPSTEAAAPTAPGARAADPSAWEPLSAAGPGQPGPSQRVDLTRSPDGILHIAWAVRNADGTSSLKERRLTPIGPGGDDLMSTVSTPISSWLMVGDPAGVDIGDGYQLYLGGQQSADPDTLDGLVGVSNVGPNADPAWSAPLMMEPGEAAMWAQVAQAPSQTPVFVFEHNSMVVADRPDATPPAAVPASGGNVGAGSIVIDPTNSAHAVVAWCEFGGSEPGTHEQVYDTGTGAFLGSPTLMPGTADACVLQATINRGTPLALRGNDAYVGGTHLNASTGVLTDVRVWQVGDATAEVVGRSRTGVSAPQVTTDSCGRIWVAWLARRDGTHTLLARRSNEAATEWGATVAVEPPAGWSLGSFEAIASCVRGPGQLDVVGQFEKPGKNVLQRTVVRPGLSLAVVHVEKLGDGSKRVTYLATDAGRPVVGARVHAHGVSAFTGTDGKVTLRFTGDTSATVTGLGYSDGQT